MRRRIIVLVALVPLAVIATSGWSFYTGSPSVEPYRYLESSNVAATPNSNSKKKSDLIVRYMGAGTLSFDDGQTAIMEDGFFSRPSVLTVVAGKVAPDEKRIDWALQQAHISRLAAIFVAHSHYDHVLDTGVVALKTGATVLGSKSTANAVEGAGLPADRVRIVKDGSSFNYGKFKITVFETPHSPHPTSVGVIDHILHTPAKEGDFKIGRNFSYLVEHGARRILVIASGNYVPGKFKGVKADVVFLGIGSLGKQSPQFAQQYWHEAVQQTGARLVIPIHWDNFFKPLNERFTALPRKLDAFDKSMDMLLPIARRDHVTVQLPTAFTPIDLDRR